MDTRIQRELRLLKANALISVLLFAVLILLGATKTAKQASATFDTVTVHRIKLLDRQGKLAMVLTNHDDPQPSIMAGKTMYRQGGGGNEIIFYNQLGDEQGGLMWDGSSNPDGSNASSANVMSFDTANTDQLLQVRDGNENGKVFSYVIGWNRPNYKSAAMQKLMDELYSAKTDSERQAIFAQHPDLMNANVTRYLFGYDNSNTAQVMLADGKGHPRIKMFVTPEGESQLQFLDANGKVTAEFPQSK